MQHGHICQIESLALRALDWLSAVRRSAVTRPSVDGLTRPPRHEATVGTAGRSSNRDTRCLGDLLRKRWRRGPDVGARGNRSRAAIYRVTEPIYDVTLCSICYPNYLVQHRRPRFNRSESLNQGWAVKLLKCCHSNDRIAPIAHGQQPKQSVGGQVLAVG
ncbi:hypothetical protein EVAR_28737_1 [Eumeta japonica]|uniref:Uncharacterized protein n=1 Tax=Eumeta variegata TaxID=151549 RepID=A0A4C1V500_EUMVA|nr:hypothetical protein EVAR_28737_1 [Eumeta japonica]